MLGQYGSASGPGGGFSAHQTLERLQPQTLIARVLAAVRGGGARGEFTDRLDRDEIRRRVQGLRGQIRTEARRRAAEGRGRERGAKQALGPLPDPVDLLIRSVEPRVG